MEGQKTILAAALAFLLLIAARGGAVELKDVATYWLTTGEKVTVAWDGVTGADHYVYRIRSLERNALIKIEGREETETTATQFSFVVPFAGHFVAEVKAVAGDKSSTWATSDNKANAQINGEPRAWWLYGHIAPAGGVEINQNIKEATP